MTYSYLNIQKQKNKQILNYIKHEKSKLHLSETPIQATGQGINTINNNNNNDEGIYNKSLPMSWWWMACL